MNSLRSTVFSLGLLLSSSISAPAWAAPQTKDTVTTASNLREAISISNSPFQVESTPSTNLIKKVNNQLSAENARKSPPQRKPSFQWQSELLGSQRRSDIGYQFYKSDF